MGSIERRVGKLEAHRERSARSLTAEALRLLSHEDLRALEEVVEESVERGEGNFRDLFAATQEHGRRALDALFAAMNAARRGDEPPEDPNGREALDLLMRVNEGDEEAKREYEEQDGYRIWKYCRKENRR